MARNVCYVNSNGVLNWNDCGNENGVRPFWWIVRTIRLVSNRKECSTSKERITFLALLRDKYKRFFMTDFQKLTDFQNLYDSYEVSLRGCRNSTGAIRFSIMAMENIFVMKKQLVEHTYKISPYKEFVVTEPKRRVIRSGSFRDKVLQHCLCDFVLLPKMKDVFIRDNYAGQAGKGTLFGLDRLSQNMFDFYEEHGCDGYILKCDISKFFYSIDHEILKEIVAKHFPDEDIQWICERIIDSTDNPGLPLGNQSSQVFALMYLSDLDVMVTEGLGCKYYGRYMDDFYLIAQDKEYLKHCLKRIGEHLGDIRLSLNSKTEIVPLSKGIRFLGFHSYLTEDGNVIRILTGDNKRQIKKRFRKYAKLVASGRMTEENYYERYHSWRNHALHGNCYRLVSSMDAFVSGLLHPNTKVNT